MTAMPNQGSVQPAITTPESFLTECQRRGIKLTARDGTIKASGKPPINPEKFAAFLKSKKPELLALLTPTRAGELQQVATKSPSELGQVGTKSPSVIASDPPDVSDRSPASLHAFRAWAEDEAQKLTAAGLVPDLEPQFCVELLDLVTTETQKAQWEVAALVAMGKAGIGRVVKL